MGIHTECVQMRSPRRHRRLFGYRRNVVLSLDEAACERVKALLV